MKRPIAGPTVLPIITAHKLTRVFTMGPAQVVGVQDIDLSIAPGELVVIKGASGSGKSTLLSLLAGLDRPTRGSLQVGRLRLQDATAKQLNGYRREVVGMVFQSFNLLPTLTVLENVALPGLLAGRTHTEVHREALQWLDRLQLASRLGHYPAELSGGEMQRTAIARALINQPSIVLADEPTGNLDSRNGQVVVDLLVQLNREWGRTVIMATHSTLADPWATVRVHLKDGMMCPKDPWTA